MQQQPPGSQPPSNPGPPKAGGGGGGSLVWIRREILDRLRNGQFVSVRKGELEGQAPSLGLDRRRWFSPLMLTKQCIVKSPEAFDDRLELLLKMGQWVNHPTQKVLLLQGPPGSGKTSLGRALIEMMGGGQEQLLWLDLDCFTKVSDVKLFLFQFLSQILHDMGVKAAGNNFSAGAPVVTPTAPPPPGTSPDSQQAMAALKQTSKNFQQSRASAYGATVRGNPMNQNMVKIQDLAPLLQQAQQLPFLIVFDNMEEMLGPDGSLRVVALKEIFNFLLAFSNIKIMLIGDFEKINELDRALKGGIATSLQMTALTEEQQRYYLGSLVAKMLESLKAQKPASPFDRPLTPAEKGQAGRFQVLAAAPGLGAPPVPAPSPGTLGVLSKEKSESILRLVRDETVGRPWFLQLACTLTLLEGERIEALEAWCTHWREEVNVGLSGALGHVGRLGKVHAAVLGERVEIIQGHALIAKALTQLSPTHLLVLRMVALMTHPSDLVSVPAMLAALFNPNLRKVPSENETLAYYGNGVMLFQEPLMKALLKQRIAPQRLLSFLKQKMLQEKHFQPWFEVVTPVKQVLLETMPPEDAAWIHRGLAAYYTQQLTQLEAQRFYPQDPLILKHLAQFHQGEADFYTRRCYEAQSDTTSLKARRAQELLEQETRLERLADFGEFQEVPLRHRHIEGPPAAARRVPEEAAPPPGQPALRPMAALSSQAYLPKLNLTATEPAAAVRQAAGVPTHAAAETLGQRPHDEPHLPPELIAWYEGRLPRLVDALAALEEALELPAAVSLERFWHEFSGRVGAIPVGLLLAQEGDIGLEKALGPNFFEGINPLNRLRKALEDAQTMMASRRAGEAKTLLVGLIETVPTWYSKQVDETVSLLARLGRLQRQCAEQLLIMQEADGVFLLLESALHALEEAEQPMEAGMIAVQLGHLYHQTGALAHSIRAFEAAAAAIPKLPIGQTLGNVYAMLADMLFQTDAHPQAINAYQQAIRYERDQLDRDPRLEYQLMMRLGESLFRLQEWQRCEQAFANAYQLAKAQQFPIGQFAALVRLGDVHLAWHPTAPEVRQCYEKALKLADLIPGQIPPDQLQHLQQHVSVVSG